MDSEQKENMTFFEQLFPVLHDNYCIIRTFNNFRGQHSLLIFKTLMFQKKHAVASLSI